MADHHLAALADLEHPAPHRERVLLAALIFGLLAAPLAWALQLVINYAASSYVCFPGDVPHTGVGEDRVWMILLMVELVALAVAIAGAAVAERSWNTTRHETSGHAQAMVDVGHGRTRFLAMWGLMLSIGFALAIVFSLVGLFMVPLCGS
ncbi:hypothetical protein AUC71_05245 [Methyloceanibacter marginalis]|uniref:Uncharacterized protein n=1 Tax=Methyloceanibacter marginalis TaxID=1774971 RepID=A0A1E3VJC1_9HYPH|nr:hypothetical protein [Methyloceanibacter marginalis]ODR93391.1 hypothetical protein AUC71_05245 [Methyloceanibacter marginalis]